ncbi:MAG: molybdenum cofactor biosynthesis protein MoaB [Armatimonadetes bacterium]|nr:molybdenum cofactor biosynthesis protein MoaB [Armatimonadota bacterium]
MRTTPANLQHKQESPKNVRAFVITVSDTRTGDTDASGKLITNLLQSNGHNIVGYAIVKDEPADIDRLLRRVLANPEVETVILNGGTGITSRDSTYEVVSHCIDKRLDGFGELFRYLSYEEIGSAAIMSRAIAGVGDGKVLISLPGSENAVRLAMNRLVIPELTHMVGLAGK